MLHKIHALQKLLMNYGLSEIPLYVTEWNLSFASRNYLHDSIYKGAYIIKNVIDCLHQTDSLTYWGCLLYTSIGRYNFFKKCIAEADDTHCQYVIPVAPGKKIAA